ncbi:MAG: GTPase HflX [Atopobiaceae bacterium]|nr:GTPase HflX [Atopobiaceae bacterium]
MGRIKLQSTAIQPERAWLVGVDLSGKDRWPLEQSLAELARLVETDGAEVVGSISQKLERRVPKTYIGKGKAEELAQIVKAQDIDVVIFDDELTPSQQSSLEHIVGKKCKVIDRTALILDIFANHATTKEGRLQVQLAQLQYLLPRLRGMWSHLVREQTRGGIGSRFGQGESQLEVDRRLVRERITSLRHELVRLERQRSVQSKARWDSGVFRVALAGYTNAGKSTLLNRLTSSDVYVKDELFATLDPTTRSLDLPNGRKITLTDTVGFIQKLPTTLVESFKSTLAELAAADLVLIVVDASDPHHERQVKAVRETLKQIEADSIPSLLVLNKSDLLDDETRRELARKNPDAVFISALEGLGAEQLLIRIGARAAEGDVVATMLVPYGKGMLIKLIHESCQIVRETYENHGFLVTAKVPRRLLGALDAYRIDKDENDPDDLEG